MDFSQVREFLDQECNFPIEQETLVQRMGDAELDALEAEATEAETIATVLGRTGESTYRTADDAYHAIIGTVDDAYIGRKHYDDRGGVHRPTEESVRDDGSPTDTNGTDDAATKGRARHAQPPENRREIDIEDQGQAIDAGADGTPELAPVDGEDTDPGPEDLGAREATQKSGEAPTEILDEDADAGDE